VSSRNLGDPRLAAYVQPLALISTTSTRRVRQRGHRPRRRRGGSTAVPTRSGTGDPPRERARGGEWPPGLLAAKAK
jgi:hypothetical protein